MSKELRGHGTVYRQSKLIHGERVYGACWWIAYYVRGKLHRESSRSTERKDAVKLLKHRIGQSASGKVIGPTVERVTLAEMIAALRDDYDARRNRSGRLIDRVEKHLLSHFGERARAVDLTRGKIQGYVEGRQSQLVRHEGKMVKPSDSTINGELRLLRRAFNVMVQARRLSHDDVPAMPMLAESPARQGFLDPPEFARLLAELPADLRDPVGFLYHSGWRRNEMQTLEWRDIDLTNGTIRLRPERSKNKRARLLKVRGELLAIIERAAERRDPALPVFHRDGQPIGDFRKTWRRACEAVGLGEILIHDLRRSAVRNMIRSGISQHVAMAISGHRTATIFSRYDIVDETDLDAAAQQIDTYVRDQSHRAPKVVPLRRQTA